jgi:hypothetical protein
MRTQPRLTILHRGAGKPDTSQYMYVQMYVHALCSMTSRVVSPLVEDHLHTNQRRARSVKLEIRNLIKKAVTA